jgi:hypothetical protein
LSKPLRCGAFALLRENQVAGKSRKPKAVAKAKKPSRLEQNQEATVEEFEREGMGVAAKE